MDQAEAERFKLFGKKQVEIFLPKEGRWIRYCIDRIILYPVRLSLPHRLPRIVTVKEFSDSSLVNLLGKLRVEEAGVMHADDFQTIGRIVPIEEINLRFLERSIRFNKPSFPPSFIVKGCLEELEKSFQNLTLWEGAKVPRIF